MKKIAVSLLAASTLVMAADAKKNPGLETHAELGYVQTNGNTETKTFNAELNLKKEWEKSEFNADLEGQYASDSGVETKNKYAIELDYGYRYTPRLTYSYLIGYKSDKFSGFEYQFYTGPGAKYKAIVQEKHKLNVEANILYSVDQYEAVPPVLAYKDDYASYRLKGVYDWKILDTLKFQQKLTLRGSLEKGDNYFITSKTAFQNKINSIFSAGISYKVDYVNIPADGKKKTDTTLAVNLIMDY